MSTIELGSFKKVIEQSIRETYEKVMFDEIDQLHAKCCQRLDEFTNIQKNNAKKTAAKMALEILHKMDVSGISIELKI